MSLSTSQLDEVDWIPHTFPAKVFIVQIKKVGLYTLPKLHIILLIFHLLLGNQDTFKGSF